MSAEQSGVVNLFQMQHFLCSSGLFSPGVLPAIACSCTQLKSVFAYTSLCLTILSANRVLWIVSAVSWLSVICQLISVSFNAQAIKSNMQGRGMIVSTVKQICCNSVLNQSVCSGQIGQMLVWTDPNVHICSNGGLSMPAWTKDSKWNFITA